MKISRRKLLAASAAMAAAVVIRPPSLASARTVSPKKYGYTFDEEFYPETDFASHEEALQAAINAGYEAESVITSEVQFIGLTLPNNCADHVVDALINSNGVAEGLINGLLVCNEEADYEGEFDSACYCTDLTKLDKQATALVETFLRDAGFPAEAHELRALEGVDYSDAALDALSKNETLEKSLRSLLEAFVADNKLEGELRGLTIADSRTHPLSLQEPAIPLSSAHGDAP